MGGEKNQHPLFSFDFNFCAKLKALKLE